MEKSLEDRDCDMQSEHGLNDEEKGFLEPEHIPAAPPPARLKFSRRLWFSLTANTLGSAGIVFTNKRIFENLPLRHAQVSFAAFHFAVTAGLLWLVSRPAIALFAPKRVAVTQILPLACAMILNVVLPNASLAYSTVQFYQVSRVLMTPAVAAINFLSVGVRLPAAATLTLLPMCVGVALVSYFETAPEGGDRGGTGASTTPLGVAFALAGVLASATYNVWIKTNHSRLECNSMQLLLNQAPVSVFVMLYLIPFSDDVTVYKGISGPTWALIALSGALACIINLSQFVVIHEAGPVSSTVAGHLKTCIIIVLGWLHSGRSSADGSLVGLVLAMCGIVSYSYVMHRHAPT